MKKNTKVLTNLELGALENRPLDTFHRRQAILVSPASHPLPGHLFHSTKLSNMEGYITGVLDEPFIQQGPGTTDLRQPQGSKMAHLNSADVVSQRVTIESLPDDVLLEIFYLYKFAVNEEAENPWKWHKLIHVCRRWRCVVFASPLRLNLGLLCTPKTPVRKLLHIWPTLPLDIQFHYRGKNFSNLAASFDDLIAALEHRDRVRQIRIAGYTGPQFERIATLMQESFPALQCLALGSVDRASRISDTFLNGSAPTLQVFGLFGISFPSLPRLLSSTTHLTTIRLWDIPNTGYFSPESMATCLPALTKLESLTIRFKFLTPHPERRSQFPLPSQRTLLPALTYVHFTGVSEWLEVLAAQIDAPVLDVTWITFFDPFVFDMPQIARFIGQLNLSRLSDLTLAFNPNSNAKIHCSPPKSSNVCAALEWGIPFSGLALQVSSIAQMCTHVLPLGSSVESLHIVYPDRWGEHPPIEIQPDDMDPTRWLELFRPFASVQELTISAKLEPSIGAALQGLTAESAAKVFPTLRDLSIDGPTTDRAAKRGIESFVTARQHSDHPVAVHLQ
jgi:hypothetical protein